MKITTSGAANRNAYYDRNPTTLTTLAFASLNVAPHASTQRWTYTVPTGRKAYLSVARVALFRNAAAAPVGNVEDYMVWQNVYPAQLEFFNNAAGAYLTDHIPHSIIMLAGQNITAFSSDASTGGTVSHWIDAAAMEFDA